MSSPADPIAEAVLAFIAADTWDESKRLVEEHRDLLLTDGADEVFVAFLARAGDNPDVTGVLNDYRALLTRCRREGIDAAFADRLKPAPADDPVAEAVLALVNAGSREELRQVVARAREMLLSTDADAVFDRLAAQYEKQPGAAEHIESRRALLERLRVEEGVPDDDGSGNAFPGEVERLVAAFSRHVERREFIAAIDVGQQLLISADRGGNPEFWAAVQGELGNAFAQSPLGDRAQNLEQAIGCYRAALEVYTREAFPERWATTQNNLGNAYDERIAGERAQNLEQAIGCYRAALEVYTPHALPQACRDTANALGALLYGQGRYREARGVLEMAHEAIEALRGEVSREGARRALTEENAGLYARLVRCCLEDGDTEAAFSYAVAAKGRAFIDLLASARVDLDAIGADDPALAADLLRARELRRAIDDLWTRLLQPGQGEDESSERSVPLAIRASWRRRMEELQTEESELWAGMAFRYPAMTATQQAPSLSVADAQRLARDIDATLIEIHEHAGGWIAFIVSADRFDKVDLPRLGDKLTVQLIIWLNHLENGRGVGRNPHSYKVLSELHTAVFGPLTSRLAPRQRVVLAPFGWLHLVPLGAARNPATGRYAAEEYTLAFTPSLAALRVQADQRRVADADGERDTSRLLSVAYPGLGKPGDRGYLTNVLAEARAIGRYFPAVDPLWNDAATPRAVIDHAGAADVIHFGCHGDVDLARPDQSGLLLAGGWLTVRRVISDLRLARARLVTVAACLTGRMALRHGEEHSGLVQALFTAGAPTVAGALWSVPDDATRVLFEVFYARLAAGQSPAVAMREAADVVRRQPDRAHPYYWAAFPVSGLAFTISSIRAADGATPDVEMKVAATAGVRAAGRDDMHNGDEVERIEAILDDAQAYLEDMASDPEGVMGLLDDAGRTALAEHIQALREEVEQISSVDELLMLAERVHRLIEDTPALAAEFLPPASDVNEARAVRQLTQETHEKAAMNDEERFVRERLPRVRTAVIRVCDEVNRLMPSAARPDLVIESTSELDDGA